MVSAMGHYTMGQSFGRELGEQICTHKTQMMFGISLALVLIVLSIVSLTVVEPDGPTFVIVVVNIVSLLAVLVCFSVAVVVCTRRSY